MLGGGVGVGMCVWGVCVNVGGCGGCVCVGVCVWEGVCVCKGEMCVFEWEEHVRIENMAF